MRGSEATRAKTRNRSLLGGEGPEDAIANKFATQNKTHTYQLKAIHSINTCLGWLPIVARKPFLLGSSGINFVELLNILLSNYRQTTSQSVYN